MDRDGPTKIPKRTSMGTETDRNGLQWIPKRTGTDFSSYQDQDQDILLHQGLSEPEFYGDLVYKFIKIVGRVDFSDQFRKIIVRYKRIGYNINIMRQSACLVFNPITVNNFASLFNCTPVGQASDSMMAPT